MRDLIDRQAAIDAIGEKSDEIFKTKQKGATYPHDDFFQGMAYAENVVKRLPPAQPELCEDAVSRKAVIDTIDEWKEACADSGHKETVSDIKLIRKDFIELPPVQPQRTGKWIPKDGRYYCDRCGGIAPKGIRWDFCPNCGAKMEGVAE